jgi:hypothetical protein
MRFVRMAVAGGTAVAGHAKVQSPQELAPLLAALLSPASVVALVLAFWRLGADLGWTGQFAISAGLFSHWQVWMALAVGLQTWAAHLSKTQKKHQDPRQ